MKNSNPIHIRFKNHKGILVDDYIRAFFTQEVLLEPYQRNKQVPAVVLTNHSWIPVSDIVEYVKTN